MERKLAWCFILVSALIRMMPHPWNVTPIVGISLFCGATLSRGWAVGVPVLTMALGDLILGWVPVHLFGWLAVGLTGSLGFLLRRRRSPGRVIGASLAGSTLFFLISNLGVWILGCGPGWYPASLQGLFSCIAAGIPFYRNALVGDLLYCGVLFGSFELSTRWIPRRWAPAADSESP